MMMKKESGFIGKPDVMRSKAEKSFDKDPDFRNFPVSPSSASAVRKEKMRLYKKGGSVNKVEETPGGSLTDEHYPYSIALKKGGKAKVTSEMRKAMKGRAKKPDMRHEEKEVKLVEKLEKMHKMNKGGVAYKKGGKVANANDIARKDNAKADTGKSKARVIKPGNKIMGKETIHPKVANGEKPRDKSHAAHKDKSGVQYCKKGGKARKSK